MLERLRAKRSSITLVATERWKFEGMVSARRAAGPSAWVIDHLVLPEGDGGPLSELLQSASSAAALRGAERLLLRLPEEWDLQKLACRSGFVVSHQVLQLTLPGRSPLYQQKAAFATRLRRPVDDMALFRMYNACTPAEVRFKTGLTLNQWKDAQEPAGRRTRQIVIEQQGAAACWVRTDTRRGWRRVHAMTDPQSALDLPALVAYVTRLAGRRRILWEVPEYQADLHLLLERMGFEVSGCYRLLVNSLAPMVRERAWSPVPTSV
ncbi:MAG: hypothetical protein HY532_00105 [Chloroflexi bacterium]|nr:hypothetical protein [Chloroflexota bacterium]